MEEEVEGREDADVEEAGEDLGENVDGDDYVSINCCLC